MPSTQSSWRTGERPGADALFFFLVFALTVQNHRDYHFCTGGVDHVNDPVAISKLLDTA